MEKAPLNGISAFLGTAILSIFVIALAESISAGFAGFWGGLPFWLIIIFVLGLAVYNFLEETIGLSEGMKFILQVIGILYAGITLAYGSWKGSSYVTKFESATFRLPLADTEHMLSQGWLQGIWVALTIFFIVLTAYMVMKRFREFNNA
jgi:hypothetical protein